MSERSSLTRLRKSATEARRSWRFDICHVAVAMNRPEHGSINAKDLIAHRPLSPTFVAYNHCHNTVHEDSAMLMGLQLLTGLAGSPQAAITAS